MLPDEISHLNLGISSVSYLTSSILKCRKNGLKKFKRLKENCTIVACKCFKEVISLLSVKHLFAVENLPWILIKANLCCKHREMLVLYCNSMFFFRYYSFWTDDS